MYATRSRNNSVACPTSVDGSYTRILLPFLSDILQTSVTDSAAFTNYASAIFSFDCAVRPENDALV